MLFFLYLLTKLLTYYHCLVLLDHVKEIKKEISFHPVLEEESKNPMNGSQAQKHIAQQVKI